MTDSKVIDTNTVEYGQVLPVEEELIYSTSASLLFRIRKDGRYFLLKRSAVKGIRGRKILRREYELSVGCDHPNIIDVYEYRKIYSSGNKEGESDEEYELVMEYVEGRTLAEFLEEKPSHKTKKRIFSEILAAVAYLHQRRIIHNDLKPANILVSRNGDHVKLIDFGLSDDDAHFEIKTPGFSDEFAAPELSRHRNSDVRSDLYSLGKIMRGIFGKRYLAISEKCLRKNPAKRFQDIYSLEKAWKRTYITWMVPVGILFLLLISVGLFALVKEKRDRQEKIESLQKVFQQHAEELKLQSEIHEKMNEEAIIASDSSKTEPGKSNVTATNVATDREKAKGITPQPNENRKIIDEFRASLSKLSAEALDSISKSEDFQEIVFISQNYWMKVKALYESRMAAVSDEASKSEITSVMLDESTRFDTRFHNYLREEEKKVEQSQSWE